MLLGFKISQAPDFVLKFWAFSSPIGQVILYLSSVENVEIILHITASHGMPLPHCPTAPTWL